MANTSSKAIKKKSTAKKSTASAKTPEKKPIRREIGAVVCLFLGLFSVIGYFRVDAWFINFFSNFVKGLIGWGYWIFPPALLYCAYILASHKGKPVTLRLTATLLLPVTLGAIIQAFASKAQALPQNAGEFIGTLYRTGKVMTSGGLLAGSIGELFRKLFSVYGAAPLMIVAFAAFLLLALRIRPEEIIEKIKARQRVAYEPIPEVEPEQRVPAKPETPAPVVTSAAAGRRTRSKIDIPLDGEQPPVDEYADTRIGLFNAKPRVRTPDQVYTDAEKTAAASETPQQPDASAQSELPPFFRTEPRKGQREAVKAKNTGIAPGTSQAGGIAFTQDSTPEEEATTAVEIADPPILPGKLKAEDVAKETASIAREIESEKQEEKPVYEFPPLELLKIEAQSIADSRGEVSMNRERLESTIHSFGVNANICGVTRGPTVTRYDLELEAGVKLNKLTNLSNDLALSLGVSSVRIAPIPDKISTVGIEVPNKLVSMVYLREIIASREFQNAASKLSFAIGKDIGGNPVVGNISKLPHLLIAGTTGSGKSVCMNSLILSLIYKASPDEVRLIMIDPKMVELGIYNGIPHLYIPVVTDPKKAAGALQWAVVEMMKRYRLFSEIGVRDLAGYNAYQKRNNGETMPQIVVVIDELADLMLVASKEVEESICRVAQMGRASGVHLIIATQRPSADVITGLMKANIPSRIAFAVSSAMESRIILDTQGAEKLIGQGDMLYAPLGAGKPLRIQGAFVSDEEREEVIRFVKAGAEANYSEEILSQIELAAENSGKNGKAAAKPAEADSSSANDYDELLPQAVEVILETKQASVSMLQRRLKLGYSRAARLVDQMEEMGVVGPFEGSKPRQLLITKEQWQEMQLRGSSAAEDSADRFEPEVYGFAAEDEENEDF
ncbi:MAG: DNA translocase FtsK [Oscillospiraceae bacterium]|nr:DNA translocase FtsK [Oscillospiraceae bacterium]